MAVCSASEIMILPTEPPFTFYESKSVFVAEWSPLASCLRKFGVERLLSFPTVLQLKPLWLCHPEVFCESCWDSSIGQKSPSDASLRQLCAESAEGEALGRFRIPLFG